VCLHKSAMAFRSSFAIGLNLGILLVLRHIVRENRAVDLGKIPANSRGYLF
jgi:hypothetical protein